MSGITKVTGAVYFDSGERMLADNDADYHDAPSNRSAILFQEVSLNPSADPARMEAELKEAFAGRDVLLLELEGERPSGAPGPTNAPQFAVVFADEICNMDDAKVGGRITVNGKPATIRATADSNEDGFARQLRRYLSGGSAAVCFFAAGVLSGTLIGSGLFLLAGGGAACDFAMNESVVTADQRPFEGLTPPTAKLPTIKGRGSG